MSIKDEGITLVSNVGSIDFVGAGVTGSSIGADVTETIPGGAGSGTVTTVSVATANGFSGTVANATTTPAITIIAGAIVPTSVNGLTLAAQAVGFTIAGGTISKTLTVPLDASVSGTNTGDQTNISGNAATVTTNANLTGPITSVGNATSVASQTGTGSTFVMDTSPTLVTPTLGDATATSIANGLGAAGTPSYTFTGDLNTGIFSSGADAIAFVTAGISAQNFRSDQSVNFTPSASTGTANTSFKFSLPNHSALTASTEYNSIATSGHTHEFATGAMTLQRDVLFDTFTANAVGASTFTDLYTVGINSATAGLNVTATHRGSLILSTGATSSADNFTLRVASSTAASALTLGTSLGPTSASFSVIAAGDTLDVGTVTNHVVNLLQNNLVRIAVGGGGTFTHTGTAAGSGSATWFSSTCPNHTALTASTEAFSFNFATGSLQHATGALTTQRAWVIQNPTYSFVGASVLTTTATFEVLSTPAASTNATFTKSWCVRFGSTNVNVGPTSAGMTYGVEQLVAHTVTVTGSTQVTTAIGMCMGFIGQLTVADVSAVTIDTSAGLYIQAAPVASGSVTLTKSYSIFIDAGLPRIDSTTANGAVATVLGSVGPTGASTTVQEWLTIDINGTTRFIPCF